MADIPQVVSTEPAQKVPGLMDLASSFIDPTALAAKGVQEAAANKPSDQAVRDAQVNRANILEERGRKEANWEKTYTTLKDEYAAAAAAYQDKATQELPKQQQVQPQPSRALSMYLSPTKDEGPEVTIGKFLQTMSLFATMVGGGRQGARASLSAMTGMLEGWREGNRYKADTQYQAWKDSTEAMFRAYDDEMRRYNSLMVAERIPLDQKYRALEIAAYEHKNDMLASQAKLAENDAVQAHFDKMNDTYQKAIRDYASIVERKREADATQEFKIKQLEQMGAIRQQMVDVKNKQVEMQLSQMKQQLDAVANVKPETMMALGQQWFLSGQMPSIGWGGKGTALAFRARVLDAGIAWAKSQGIDPMSAPHVRAEIKAAQQGMNVLSRQSAQQEASIRRFDGHVDQMLKLSEQVPRSEMPAVNNAILRGERQFEGSPAAAAYVAQSFELGMELARMVLPGSAQGDAATREDARNMISAAFNHEQLKAVLGQLRQNGMRNVTANRDSLQSYGEIISKYGTPGASTTPTPTPPSGGGPAQQTQNNPYNLKQEGGDWVSPDGKYVWRGGAWQKR